MKKNFLPSLIISLFLSSSALLAMEKENFEKCTYTSKKCTADFAIGVKELNPYLYMAQKEPDFYLILERVDKAVPGSRLSFWKNYVAREWNNHTKYKREWMADNVPYGKGFLQFLSRSHDLTSGIESFASSVNNYNLNNELWIAFSSSKPIKDTKEITLDDIEIAVPVMTDKDSPMVTPMGLGRSFHYLLKALEVLTRFNREKWLGLGYSESDIELYKNKFKVHPGTTMDILSFIAKVMKMRNENKLYLINSPVPPVRNMMIKALPDHVYVGDNVRDNQKLAKEIHESIKEQLPSYALYIECKNLDEDKIFTTESDELFDLHSDIEDKEIDAILQQLADKVVMTPQTSPIRKSGGKIQIFDKERKHILFEHDKELNIIFVNNEKLEGDATARYNWFYHEHMGRFPYVTIDLDALANLKPLMVFEEK